MSVTASGEITGRILTADADGVRLAVNSAKPKGAPREQTFSFDELGPGRVQVEFNRALAKDADDADHTDEVAR